MAVNLTMHYYLTTDAWTRLGRLSFPNLTNVSQYGAYGTHGIGEALLRVDRSDEADLAAARDTAVPVVTGYTVTEPPMDALLRRTVYRSSVMHELATYALRPDIRESAIAELSNRQSLFGLAPIFLSLLTDPAVAASAAGKQFYNGPFFKSIDSPIGICADAGTPVYDFASQRLAVMNGADVMYVIGAIQSGNLFDTAWKRAYGRLLWTPTGLAENYYYLTSMGIGVSLLRDARADGMSEAREGGGDAAAAQDDLTAADLAAWSVAADGVGKTVVLAGAALSVTGAIIAGAGLATPPGLAVLVAITAGTAATIAVSSWLAKQAVPPNPVATQTAINAAPEPPEGTITVTEEPATVVGVCSTPAPDSGSDRTCGPWPEEQTAEGPE